MPESGNVNGQLKGVIRVKDIADQTARAFECGMAYALDKEQKLKKEGG
jgi:hypothetical protein